MSRLRREDMDNNHWVNIKDALPTKDDAYEGDVLISWAGGVEIGKWWEVESGDLERYWMPIPRPPI